jgi:phospholipase C
MIERRGFLKLSALAAGFSSPSIRRAMALPANHRAGTIEDVQHIVILMQENRSFDHYFGTLRGVRGHNDRWPLVQADGRPVWMQPRQNDAAQHILPFHLDTSRTGAQAVTMLDHSWKHTQAAFNGGLYNAWPQNKTDMTMGFFTRQDIPYHFELADAFTICDQYFCSVPGPTHPNRMYLMTGMVDPTGAGGGPLIDNADVVDKPSLPPFTWSTYPERLEQAGISWQVYQQGLDWKDPYNGNYGLNVLQNFQQFIDAPEGSSLQRRGFSVRTLDQFAEDARSGKLPQVSWLMPPAAFSEHPKYMPAYGATYISQVLDALTADPEVWSRTVLLVMYDENDGYFDHCVPPQPPTPVLPGASTVSVEGEIHNVVNPLHHPLYTADNLPYGLGPRVPMFVISPWSKGGFVNSQVFDHTSVIRFIEARFGVNEPNISPWRRAVCGDLVTAFDFARPDAHIPRMPDTSGYRARADEEVKTLPVPMPPGASHPDAMMGQEPGLRPARALPYLLNVDFTGLTAQGAQLRIANMGTQGASFYVYVRGATTPPLRYTVGSGDNLEETIPVPAGAFELGVYGPNGFFRGFKHTDAPNVAPGISVAAVAEEETGTMVFEIHNTTPELITVVMSDNAYGHAARHRVLGPNETYRERWDLTSDHHWYDLTVTACGFAWRVAGHVETGKPSFSDPAAKAPMLTVA